MPVQHVIARGSSGTRESWLTLPTLSAEAPSEDLHDEHQVKRTVARGLSTLLAVAAGGTTDRTMPSLDDLLHECEVVGLYDMEVPRPSMVSPVRWAWLCAVQRAGASNSRHAGNQWAFTSGSQLAFVKLDGAIVKGWLARDCSVAPRLPLAAAKALEALLPLGAKLTFAVFPAGFVLVPESVVRRCCSQGGPGGYGACVAEIDV